MSKRAEEAQASAILPESIISYAKEHAVLSGLVYREGVKYGYEQAEKDLELTWQDIKDIHIAIEFFLTHTAWDDIYYPTDESLYTEVLKRYNEQKNQTHNDTEHT